MRDALAEARKEWDRARQEQQAQHQQQLEAAREQRLAAESEQRRIAERLAADSPRRPPHAAEACPARTEPLRAFGSPGANGPGPLSPSRLLVRGARQPAASDELCPPPLQPPPMSPPSPPPALNAGEREWERQQRQDEEYCQREANLRRWQEEELTRQQMAPPPPRPPAPRPRPALPPPSYIWPTVSVTTWQPVYPNLLPPPLAHTPPALAPSLLTSPGTPSSPDTLQPWLAPFDS